jgi:large subunit ribosomal protein L35
MLLIQRIEQMNVVPDILPEIDPIVQTALTFPSPVRADRGRKVQHGEMVDSRVSENPPNLTIQPFAKGEKLYTIVCMNPDVPNVEHDGFDYRCHFLACNIPISPTSTLVQFDKLNKSEQVVLPWLPAYAQKGLPYQRMAIFVLEQPPENKIKPGSNDEPPSVRLDLEEVKSRKDGRFSTRHMTLRSLVKEFKLSPVGVDLFRTEWDEGTPGVMKRAGVIGHDIEFKRKRVEPLPYKRLKEERYR